MEQFFTITRHVIAGILLLLVTAGALSAQRRNTATYKVSGVVSETTVGNTKKALPYASVSLPAYGIAAQTDGQGRFELQNVPAGKTMISIRYIGKVNVDSTITVNSDVTLDLQMQTSDFRLADIQITARPGTGTSGTSSRISRTAIDHLQANSLADVMALLPGGITVNPNLTNAKQINIRSVGSAASDLNAFGTTVMMNGAPMSNNANMQTMSPAVAGATGALAGGASPNAGFDVRGISMNNVESVEVIRGVPGVEYGDVTAGVVIVNTKAGAQPLSVQARVNPNVYQVSANKGMDLGKENGALNLGMDYAYNTNDPVQQYLTYQRFTGRALYSNRFFKILSSTTALDLIYGKDTRKRNPDDQVTKTASSGRDLGFIFNTRGNLSFENLWLRKLDYVARVGLTDKSSYYETQYTAANAPYSMTTVDGTILTNRPGLDAVDAQGNKLNGSDGDKYAVYLPSTYVGRYNIDGKEFNTYFKAATTFFNKIGNTDHRWLVGADFKSDKNYGAGKTFADSTPPYRNLSALNASFRTRAYKDIPALTQFGLFAEENFSANIGGNRLDVTAGVRYDRFSGDRNAISPRINANIELIPGWLSINGAWGQLAKAPSILYLHPENAFFEYVNINELANESIPADQRVLMTTTHVFNTENNDLEIAKNEKAEIGLVLNVKQASLRVTGFRETLKNGYGMDNSLNTFRPVMFNEYTRVAGATSPVYNLTASNRVLASFYTPTNNQVAKTQGLEADLNLGRFKSIRTSFAANGAWMRTETYSNNYTFYDDQSSNAGASRTHVGLYEKGMVKRNDETVVTSLRATHNIPRIGFVITFTTQVIWNDRNWNVFGNDSIPVKYISKDDGEVYDFDPSKSQEPEFKTLLRPVNRATSIKESYPPLLTFNINVTKEVAEYLRVSFFANNMFRHYQITESKRTPGNFVKRGGQFFFGLELSLTL
ncbi:TonB-dependent receptor [Chitinophaga horti]|uniref:TonB-dependent receptor n=1 Tax=Chitinophaga horti TaxID=2920382 RepID=A0ABY6J475_9BACT|nr:TonB-dependent receptor [Chitinophaga horti]UYQ94474.1 TonB-dependent receptor [Chitinophaga horti]